MTRFIALDTETTGLSPVRGDRIVEIGCVEVVHLRKGQTRQWYINPERKIPLEATRIHGITDEQVAGSPVFKEIAQDFLDFIGEDTLIIHNASFDLGFLNAELKLIRRLALNKSRVIDTMAVSRSRFPGQKATLDALCKRLKVDNSHRKLHGALLDADLLADVYVALQGGPQFSMELSTASHTSVSEEGVVTMKTSSGPVVHAPREWPLSQEEALAHEAFLDFMQKEYGDPLWRREAGHG